MNSLEFVKEVEVLKDTCQKVHLHLRSNQMSMQTLKWELDNLKALILDAQQTLGDLKAQQEQAKATAEAIVAGAKAKAESVDAELSIKRKEIQEYEMSVVKREERFEKTKYLAKVPAIA